MTLVELNKTHSAVFNPGEIVYSHGWPRWHTQVGNHQLTLDIVPTENRALGIASFVVMEQDQSFLETMGRVLASEIIKLTNKKILIMTTESKGSHFVPYIWLGLAQATTEDMLVPKIITLRKGRPKVYMNRSVTIQGQSIEVFSLSYKSITSSEQQTITMSPKDIELFFSLKGSETEAVFVDDFLGGGGSALAAVNYIEQLTKGFKPSKEYDFVQTPKIVAVIGSDGILYEKAFRESGKEIKVIPQPFPLRLPTFSIKTQ